MIIKTDNIHVADIVRFTPPIEITEALPMTAEANKTVVEGRKAVQAILTGSDQRVLVAVGPCSIQNKAAALEYAERLAKLAAELQERLFVVMRVYFEKPRTTIGWKGLINDPNFDDGFDIDSGLRLAREISLNINEIGVPVGTEMLDPITPQYLADLVTWASIGARTSESQTHRQMASGLSMPVGFKNGTDGSLEIAINAMLAARASHVFLGIDPYGYASVVKTTGNPWGHLILRGGRDRPNYHEEDVEAAAQLLSRAGLPPNLMIDCSHANSGYDFRRQKRVLADAIRQRVEGSRNIIGLMLESNLEEGSQKLTKDPTQLRHGLSITDACIGWDETVAVLRDAYRKLPA